jgi:CMP-N-acetylneuraminic acid synthetase
MRLAMQERKHGPQTLDTIMTEQPRAIALIPARSGSGRLPNKNIRPLFGHPLLAYAITAARNAGVFDKVLLSSDSKAYLRIGEHYGAEGIHRPPELASSTADLIGVSLHALDQLAAQGYEPEILCLLMPCCPLRKSAEVRRHFEVFRARERAFQLSVTDYTFSYPQWAMEVGPDGAMKHHWGNEALGRSQELNKLYAPSGAVWLVRVDEFRKQRAFYGTPLCGEPLPMPDGIDIDTPEDFRMAQALALGYLELDGRSQLEPIEREPYVVADEPT